MANPIPLPQSQPAPAPTTVAETGPTPDEQVAALEAACSATAAARAERHARTPLYERLRGADGINVLMREIVRLHVQNPAIGHLFAGLDPDRVARRSAAFMIAGSGGPNAFDGPDLTTSHRAMRLTNADFMAAGADVIQVMKNLGYGPDEIEEVVCTLVSLRPQVVLPQSEEEEKR